MSKFDIWISLSELGIFAQSWPFLQIFEYNLIYPFEFACEDLNLYRKLKFVVKNIYKY